MSKRGRLSNIDLLPDEARPHVTWAVEELKARKRTAESIRQELNEKLLTIPDCPPVQKSSFNRYSLHIAAHGAAMMQMRGAAAMMAERMDEEPNGDVGLLLVETIKSLVYSVMMNEQNNDAPDMKLLKAAADSAYRLELARSTNLKAAAFKREKFIKDVATIVEDAAKEKGLGADTVEAIKSAILGVPK